MNPSFEFTCSQCGQVHEGAPSVAYSGPLPFFELTEEEKKEAVSLKSDDLCIIGSDRFIRVCLEIPIIGFEEGFLWGVWVSLSEKNFEEYKTKFKDEYSTSYFGWFCNNLPGYQKTFALPTTVHIDGNKSRPLISINHCDHELHHDYVNGISKERAVLLYEKVKHGRKS